MNLSDDQIFEFVKCSEKCSQLSSLLLKQVSNPDKNLRKKILDELGDSLFRLWPVINNYSEEEIKVSVEKNEKR
jgi:hypothetical protein